MGYSATAYLIAGVPVSELGEITTETEERQLHNEWGEPVLSSFSHKPPMPKKVKITTVYLTTPNGEKHRIGEIKEKDRQRLSSYLYSGIAWEDKQEYWKGQWIHYSDPENNPPDKTIVGRVIAKEYDNYKKVDSDTVVCALSEVYGKLNKHLGYDGNVRLFLLLYHSY